MSGGAPGADKAFEAGATRKEIYLPWRGFEGSDSTLYPPSEAAVVMAATIHPAWDKCSPKAKLLHARNCHQILGPNLNEPVDFILCWTPKGETVGGTATGIRLAERHNITVYNLFNVSEWIDSFMKRIEL